MRRAPLLMLALLAVAGAGHAQTLTSFRTPSDNIHCLGIEHADGAVVHCEIIDKDDPAPLLPPPVGCYGDWGHRFGVADAGPGEMVCAGDTVRNPEGAVLPYGQALRFGPIACAASERGLECRNGEGHGFFLSRAAQRLF